MRVNHYQRVKQVIANAYKNINPTYLSKQARDELGITDESFIYGEIDAQSLLNLIEIAHPIEGEVFYDLGSGSGRAALIAGACFPFQRVVGIEYLPPLSLLSQNQLCAINSSKLIDEITNVEFINGDFFQVDFSQANIIFFNATACRNQNWESILEKFLAMPIGTRIILTTQRLPSPSFEVCYEGLQLMSWGMNSSYVYKKIK